MTNETKKRIEELNSQYSALKVEYDTLRKQYEDEVTTNTSLKLQLETERQEVRHFDDSSFDLRVEFVQ